MIVVALAKLVLENWIFTGTVLLPGNAVAAARASRRLQLASVVPFSVQFDATPVVVSVATVTVYVAVPVFVA